MSKPYPERAKHHLIKRMIKAEIDQLRKFIISSESFMESEVNQFFDWINKDTENMTEEEKEYHFEWHSDEYWELSELYPRIQRSSLLVNLMSFLESRLNQICEFYIDKKSTNEIKLSDLKGRGIDRALLFLRKVPKFQIDTNTKTWQSIKTFQKIRNYLVHADDNPITKDADIKTIKKYSRLEGGVTLDDSNRIQLEPSFLNQVLNVSESFFNEIFEAIDKSNLKEA